MVTLLEVQMFYDPEKPFLSMILLTISNMNTSKVEIIPTPRVLKPTNKKYFLKSKYKKFPKCKNNNISQPYTKSKRKRYVGCIRQ